MKQIRHLLNPGPKIDVSAALPRYPLRYHATFEDDRGRDEIEIENSGSELTTTLRGISLRGTDFDGLGLPATGVAPIPPFAVDRFRTLSSGTLTVNLSIGVEVGGNPQLADLQAVFVLPQPHDHPILGWTLPLSLRLADGRGPFRTSGRGGDFESSLGDIARSLPSDVRLLSCYSCGLSDYSPTGQGLFGGLACFRLTKSAYRRVSSKWDMFKLWDSMAGFVQETHLCPEWEPRPPGRGYRG